MRKSCKQGRGKVLSLERKLSSSPLAYIPVVFTKHYVINSTLLCLLSPKSSSGLSTLLCSNLPLLKEAMCGEEKYTFQLNGSYISKSYT